MSQGLFIIPQAFKANTSLLRSNDEKGNISSIAIGAVTLVAKKFLDSKAEKAGCIDTTSYVCEKGLDLLESVERKCQNISKKVDGYLENADFSTLDKIDSILGGKITKMLEGVGEIVDAGSNAVDKFVAKSSFLDPSDKSAYALSVAGGIAEGNYDDKEALSKANEWFQKWEQFKGDIASCTQAIDGREIDDLENLGRAFDKYESNIDEILDILSKSKH